MLRDRVTANHPNLAIIFGHVFDVTYTRRFLVAVAW
jgi:hypothetical protein